MLLARLAGFCVLLGVGACTKFTDADGSDGAGSDAGTVEAGVAPPGHDDDGGRGDGGSSSSGGMRDDGGTGTPSDAGDDAGGPPPPTECNTLDQLGAPVPLELGSGSAPGATGGPTDGLYALTHVRVYAPLLPVNQTFDPFTLRFTGLSFDLRVGDSHTSGNVTNSNATLVLTPTCGIAQSYTGTTFTYLKAGDGSLRIYNLFEVPGVPGSPFTMEFQLDPR